MSTYPLESLTISHLRGSTTQFSLRFERHKKLTIVYGENATGKSTVCDGFELLGSGKVGSLDNRGLGQTGRYWASTGKTPSDIEVVLKTTQASHRAKVNSQGQVFVDPPEERPQVEVLRRGQVLTLVLAAASARYAAIARFIDVAAIEDSEKALSQATKSAETGQGFAITRVTENSEAIEGFWQEAGRTGDDAMTWARIENARTVDYSSEVRALNELCSSFDSLMMYPQSLENSGEALDVATATHTEAVNARAAEAARVNQDQGETFVLLEAASHFLDNHPDPSVCPVCQSAERAAGLRGAISQRLAAYATFGQLEQAERTQEASVQEATQRRTFVQQGLTVAIEAWTGIIAAHNYATGTIVPDSGPPEEAGALRAWLDEAAVLREGWDSARRALEGDERFLGALRRALAAYDENVAQEAALSLLLPRLKSALEVVSDERHKYVDAKLAAIATEVGRLYEQVHPGEGLDKISLGLDPKQRASLNMGASFGGKDNVPPQAYFSDSHLDTLGLCIFLALSKLELASEKILVLDDVLGSVDEPHVERLIEMICAEAANFRHCVITTHYRPWKERLRWGWLRTGECHFVELASWSSAAGLSLISTLPDVGRLRLLLAEQPPDPQLVCSKAGVILEAALDFLTLLYECPVSRKKHDEYTLGDLLPAISNKLRDALKVEVVDPGIDGGPRTYTTIELKPILEELSRIAQARNAFGAHFKEISFQMLDADALAFGNEVLKLMDTLTDQDAGWPKNGNSGSYWATSGETRKLHPLRRPS